MSKWQELQSATITFFTFKNNKTKLFKTAAKDIFYPNGKALKQGEVLVEKDLANTVKQIAKHGTEVFYNGQSRISEKSPVYVYNLNTIPMTI